MTVCWYKNERFFLQKVAFNQLHLSRIFPWQLISNSNRFLRNLKKSYVFFLANKIDLLFFLAVKVKAEDVSSGIKLVLHEYYCFKEYYTVLGYF